MHREVRIIVQFLRGGLSNRWSWLGCLNRLRDFNWLWRFNWLGRLLWRLGLDLNGSRLDLDRLGLRWLWRFGFRRCWLGGKLRLNKDGSRRLRLFIEEVDLLLDPVVGAEH